MKAPALLQANMGQGEQQLAKCGRNLFSNYSPPNLENKLLVQSSMPVSQLRSPLVQFAAQSPSCSSVQTSSLTSTSSSLLSSSLLSSSLSSPLLSTQNKLLSSDSTHLSFPLTSSVPKDLLSSTHLTSTALHSHFIKPPSFPHHGADGQKMDDGGYREYREEIKPEVMQSCWEETHVDSEEQDVIPEEEDNADPATELPVVETVLDDQDLEERIIIRQEFAEVEKAKENVEEELKDKKYLLLNAVCCSLVNKNTAPGQKDWDSDKSVWTRIKELGKHISVSDPQFLLKVAVYTRQELNIRITANFLLALAAHQPTTRPHVRRYYCAAVQLPSDWLEVVRIYSTCFSNVLPTCLKKAMADKFKQFTEYQLAKYNTRKHRCKHNRNRRKSKMPSDQQLNHWANLVRADVQVLKKFMHLEDKKVVVDKKQRDFSMKKMIKLLHIKEPAQHVMAILGKKYPADAKTFIHSGMKGEWDRERAGQRMKLEEPVTWERLLSLEGNKAATWEKLIDNNSLPFMAMLRNLRNMITTGISEAHHQKILSRLTSKKAVIQSRQFPFRFLAAFKVMMQLRDLASESVQAVPPAKEILKGILKKIPKSRRFREEWESSPRKRIRVTLGVPYICRLYQMKKAQLLKANQRLYTMELLDRYCKALETAVQISCRYNIPPLPGRTVILLNAQMPSASKQDFCLPPDSEEDDEDDEEDGEVKKKKLRRMMEEREDELSASNIEIGILLSLMIASSAEDSQLYITQWMVADEVKLKSDVLLENVRSVKKEIKALIEVSGRDESRSFHRIFEKESKVDNIILLTDYFVNTELDWLINAAKAKNSKALLVKLNMSGSHEESPTDRNTVMLTGFSEQILRFVAERGSSRLLDHVEHLDKVYKIPPPEGAKDPQTRSCMASIPTSPKLRWRGVRVFISSTFRDMHAERDMLVRSVFPELRRRAAPHCLHLQEVELRWGVTEEESSRAAELCLSEVCRSQMMVGILGERYGLVPARPALPALPQYSWLASAPPGLSITEMELRQFQALYPDTAHRRMFCYFRDSSITESVPVSWRSDFAPESMEAEAKMASLKSWIRASDVKVTEDYTCEWGGVVEAKPYLKNLENFGRAVLEDLWKAVREQFVEDEDELVSDITEQDVHQEALQRRFLGRTKLLSGAVDTVEQAQSKGGVVVVEGGPGEGKTVFMAALADALRTGVKSKTKLVCDVIAYSTAASQSARSVENLLRCLIQWLRKMKDSETEPLPHSYKDLLSEFHSTLRDVKKTRPLVLLVDGVDLVQDGRRQVSSEWIPEQLPQGVCLVLSIQTKSALLQSLAKRKSCILFTLGQLAVTDRKEIVQKGLETFGKKLSDSAFNNQLQTLVMKSGAVSPLYLHLACEDLRSFASFDRLKESLQDLPQSVRELVKHSLDRLCLEYRHMSGLRWALAALTVSPSGLRERDLYSVLNTCNELSSRDAQLSWQEVLNLSRKPGGRVPMATFTRLVQRLQSLVGPSHCHNTDDLLVLTNPEVKRAFEDFLLPAESDRTRAHLILAAHLWAAADPQGADTFLHCEVNSVLHLPSSLIHSDQLEALHSLLSSYFFLYASVRHGLLHQLLETYSLFDMKSTLSDAQDRVKDCQGFLRRHAHLLASWPALFIQQALNELPDTPAHSWAQGLVGKGGVRVTEWLNNGTQSLQEASELVSTFCSEPNSLQMSLDKKLMVVGTGQGTLHFINTQTRQEVKSLESSCDGVSSCVFLMDGHLATTSFDGRIEIWDVGTSVRTALIEGHTNIITGSDVTADHKHFATVSLDFKLKVWSSAKPGNEVAALSCSSPLNCVTFDPEGHLLAAGCWDGNVTVWNWLQNKTLPPLSGHQRSVRSLCFSSSSMLCSGSVSGEVRVWSVPTATCVGCFQAHCGTIQSLSFLDGGAMLLSAGSDHMLQLWSGGLGRSVITLKSVNLEQEPPQKKQRCVIPEPAALSVAANGDYAVVGYHGNGIRVFSLELGEKMWQSGDLHVSVLCLLWVLDAEQTRPDLLVCGGSDKHLSVWSKKEGDEGLLGGLKMLGTFGVQRGSILALAQNSTHLATASDDFTIVLWLLSDLHFDASVEPQETLRGHSGGVTCLAFSPDGDQLLSGGKDQALLVWDVSSSPPVLSKSLPHCHKDWITGCVWTPDCVISSSNDGRLCLWDLQAGQRLKEISWRNALTSVCCLGQYVMAGCSEGALHVWRWDTAIEICHIGAHKQRVHHCHLLPSTVKDKEDNLGEMAVFTASEDGTVQLWKPLQVEHFNTFRGHSGTVNEIVCKEAVPEFLTVSEDGSLRNWTWTTKNDLGQRGAVSALSFSQKDGLLLVGYESGFLELWWNNRVVGHKQASGSGITTVCFMPDDQFAVGYTKTCLDVWKLVWRQQHSNASLVKVTTYKVKRPVTHLIYCSVLIGTYDNGKIFDVSDLELEDDWEHSVTDWEYRTQILNMIRKDNISTWVMAHGEGEIHLGFIFALGKQIGIRPSFSAITLKSTEELKGSLITAATLDREFVVCGDVRGNMWFNQPSELSSMSVKKTAHSDKISVLKLTDSTIISASYDRTVKLWDRNTKKQVGMFLCRGPVLVLEVNPEKPTELVCGDDQGNLYFLSSRE